MGVETCRRRFCTHVVFISSEYKVEFKSLYCNHFINLKFLWSMTLISPKVMHAAVSKEETSSWGQLRSATLLQRSTNFLFFFCDNFSARLGVRKKPPPTLLLQTRIPNDWRWRELRYCGFLRWQLLRFYGVGDRWMSEYRTLVKLYWHWKKVLTGNATISTSNPKWNALAWIPRLRSGMSATNYVNHDKEVVRD